MTYQEIRNSIGKSLGPYEVQMADGRVFKIPHTLNMAVNPNGRFLLYFDDSKNATHELPKEDITQFRVLENAKIESN